MSVLGMIYGTLLNGRGIVRISPHPFSSSVFFGRFFFKLRSLSIVKLIRITLITIGNRQRKNCLKARAKQIVRLPKANVS